MAKLYPPSIAGTLPSFCLSNLGATRIVVPFFMNKTVSSNQVKGFKLRIKTANTDILYGILDSESGTWNKKEISNPSVSFIVPDVVLSKLTIGQYYKVQLAYVEEKTGEVGYYSSIGIIKYTSSPTVSISNFTEFDTNFNVTEYIGEYINVGDPTEKVYEYKFNLYSNTDVLIETSGWLLHNSYEDTNLNSSIDRYTIKHAFEQNITYKIQYCVKTNNGLEVSSYKYLVMEAESINPEISANLTAELDYENACINLYLIGKEQAITGSFILSRASSKDNYASWLEISKFKLIGELPSKFIHKDYTIEHGVTYIYSLQQYNDNDIYSNRLLTKYVPAYFEDAYLYDGKRQLRIRFNPKITSFKTVLMENKKTTIGGKYPFITRNGNVEYKEFPISGLISYKMDNDEFFLSKEDDLYIKNWNDTTDIIDENLYQERLFKLAVLDWLNNGEIKLFKSPQEGNYIVRLMNVSLSPVDTISRMLHNFSCQANEVADFTPDALIKYNLINAKELVTYQMRWETIIFQDEYIKNAEERNKQLKYLEEQYINNKITISQYNIRRDEINNQYTIYEKDLLRGYGAYYIQFSGMILGSCFSFKDSDGIIHKIMIGATGSYEAQFDEPITELKLVMPVTSGDDTLFENIHFNRQNILPQGQVTFSILSATQNRFNSITGLKTRNIPVHQVFGPNENILAEFNNFRRNVTKLYYGKFSALEVREVYSPLFGTQIESNKEMYFSGVVVKLQSFQPVDQEGTYIVPKVYDIPTIDEDGQVVNHYYRYYNGKLYAWAHQETSFEVIGVLDAYTLYKDGTSYYRLIGDQLYPGDKWINTIHDSGSYTISYTDLTPHVIYLKRNQDSTKNEYFKYDGYKLIKLDNYSTKIEYGNTYFKVGEKQHLVTLDVGEIQEVYITEFDELPTYISIGSGVKAEIGIQVRDITYSVEDICQDEKEKYEKALLAYNVASAGLKGLSYDEVPEKTMSEYEASDIKYTIWNGKNFEILKLRDYSTYIILLKNNEIKFYIGADSVASPVDIQELYNQMILAEDTFINAMKIAIEAQEEVSK